jgi:hypothetical protein
MDAVQNLKQFRTLLRFGLMSLAGMILLCQSRAVQAQNAPVQYTVEQVRSSLQELEAVLSQTPATQPIWQEYLRLDTLRTELAKGDQADREAIATVGERLGGLEVGVDNEELAAARQALEAWMASPGDNAAATTAQRAIRSLQTWLRRNRSRAGGWSDFLDLDRWNVEVRKGEEVDLAWARNQLARFEVAANPPDAEAFGQLRSDLKHWYVELERQVTEPLAITARGAKANYVPLPPARYELALQDLRRELQDMEEYLRSGGSDKEEGWKDYLGWRELEAELQRSNRPRLDVIERAIDRFGGEAAGLDRRPFVRVQRRLRNFMATLRAAESGRPRLVDQARLVRALTERLERYLAVGGETKETGWKRYLEWNEWQNELQAEVPNPRPLAGLANRLRAEQSGLDREPFRDLEAAVSKYLELYTLNQTYSAREEYLERLETLARALDAREEADPSAQAEIRSQLEWLRGAGQADWLIARIQQERRRPNFQVQVAEQLVIQQVQDVADQRSPVGRCFEGAWVSGTADTHAIITGDLVPSPNNVALDIILHGTTFTNSVATQRRVQVYTYGNTLTQGRKRLYLDESGLTALPAVAVSSSRQQINAVQVNRRVGRRLITRAATRRAYEKKPRAENLANHDTSQAIRENMDSQARDLIANVNQSLELRVEKPLRANNLYPQQLHFSSTDQHVYLQGLVAPGDSLGPTLVPPALPHGDGLAANIHQTAVNNVLAEYLGDVTVNSDQMDALMDRFNLNPQPNNSTASDPANAGPAVAEDAVAEDAAAEDAEELEPWSITFDHLQPATVQFKNQKVTIAIVGRRFTRGADEITDRIRIRASYQIAWSDTRVELTREGDVEIDFIDVTGQLSNERLAYKSFLRRKVDPLFREKITTDDLPQNEATARLEAFRIKSLLLDNGWLTTGLDVDTTQLQGLGLK